MASCGLVAFLSASTGMAQVPPVPDRGASADDESSPAPPAPTMRPIVFTADNPEAQLEFHGIGLVDGVWRDGWIPVCLGPCTTVVPVAERYRINGSGIRRSRQFEIAAGPRPLYLQAETGSAPGHALGVAATSVGGAAMAGGLLAWAFAGFCIGDGGAPCPDPEPQRTISIAVAIVGATTLVVGIVQILRSRTVVTGDEPRAAGR